jgi:hypothetical protein
MKRTVSRHEFLTLLLWPIVASLLSVALQAQIYLGLFIFFGLPAIYLSWRHPHLIKKSLFFSVIFSVPAAFFLDYVMEYTGGWAIGAMEFPHVWILQYVSLLQIIWLILYVYLVVMYYKVFFDRNHARMLYPRTKNLIILGVAVLGFLTIAHYFNQELLHIDYFYLKIGLIAVLLPLAVFWVRRRHYVTGKFLKVGAYFFGFTLLYELTALHLGQWNFPAAHQFIGQVTIGGYMFPLEEFLFWILISSISILAYYEYFDDDEK